MTDSNLILLFGDTTVVRIIDALIDNVDSDYSKKEIQELAGISKGTLFKYWVQIEELGIVKPTRSFGRTTLYTLNRTNKIVKRLLKLEMDLIEKTTPQVIKAITR